MMAARRFGVGVGVGVAGDLVLALLSVTAGVTPTTYPAICGVSA
jgi:hypothetical protein